MVIKAMSGEKAYDIIIEEASLSKASQYLNLDRKSLIITDNGVPVAYAQNIANQCLDAHIYTIEQGENSKSMESLKSILSKMLNENFTREDCVIAVGGGVCGDLAGFAASIYMRGIDFYNIPTTVLSQVDSSIGGKTAINFENTKNIVGSFYQPSKVIIDPLVLASLPQRQINNGLAEAVKMALCFNEKLFEFFENENPYESLEYIITESLKIKNDVVTQDEKEKGLRRVLNFGHTIGHAIEVNTDFYHGECVAIGMLPMCSDKVRERLQKVLEKLNLPTSCSADEGKIVMAMMHDKKMLKDGIKAVFVEEVGKYTMKTLTEDELKEKLSHILER